MCGKGIEYLATVGEFSLQRKDIWMFKSGEGQVGNFVSSLGQLRSSSGKSYLPALPGPPANINALALWFQHDEVVGVIRVI